MTHYLIEFRFHGYAKKYLKERIYEVGNRFRVRGVTHKKVVPHVTLFGPFTTFDEKKVVSTLVSVSKRYDLIPFRLGGFGNFENRVIYANILPSDTLKRYRYELALELNKLKSFFIFKSIETKGIADYNKDYAFHATIAFKDIRDKFGGIYRYLKSQRVPDIQQKLVRVTLLKDSRILYEYDFVQKRLLNRRQALSKEVWIKTKRSLKRGT